MQPPEVLYKKKVFLKISQNSQENTCARGGFSCGFCEIFKNTYFEVHLQMATSEITSFPFLDPLACVFKAEAVIQRCSVKRYS